MVSIFLPASPGTDAQVTALQANKLNTVKKCLNEVLKYGGPFNARDLYPVRIRPTVGLPHSKKALSLIPLS